MARLTDSLLAKVDWKNLEKPVLDLSRGGPPGPCPLDWEKEDSQKSEQVSSMQSKE